MASNFLNNFTPRRDLENVSNKMMSVKSFGAAKEQSAVKKKALLDVGNTLHKKVLLSASKPSTSAETVLKKDLIKVFGDKENANLDKQQMKPKETKQTYILGISEAIKDPNVKEVNQLCHCFDMCEDEFADIMFHHIRPSKPDIEHLALVWENPPVFGVEDKRNICKEILKPIGVDRSELDNSIIRSSLEEDFEAMLEMDVNSVPPPFFSDSLGGSYGSGVDF